METLPPAFAQTEAHHRFLNTLTSLHSLLRRNLGDLRDPKVRDAVATFEAQLLTFASIQRTLQHGAGKELLEVPEHFGRLSAQLAAVLLEPRGIRCEFAADEDEMDAETGERFGLILVELFTNAAKHAFRGRERGQVSIVLMRVELGWLCDFRDDGGGLRPGQGGSGLRLIEGLARSIGARVTMSSDATGIRTTVNLPGRSVRSLQWADVQLDGTRRQVFDVDFNDAHLRAGIAAACPATA